MSAQRDSRGRAGDTRADARDARAEAGAACAKPGEAGRSAAELAAAGRGTGTGRVPCAAGAAGRAREGLRSRSTGDARRAQHGAHRPGKAQRAGHSARCAAGRGWLVRCARLLPSPKPSMAYAPPRAGLFSWPGDLETPPPRPPRTAAQSAPGRGLRAALRSACHAELGAAMLRIAAQGCDARRRSAAPPLRPPCSRPSPPALCRAPVGAPPGERQAAMSGARCPPSAPLRCWVCEARHRFGRPACPPLTRPSRVRAGRPVSSAPLRCACGPRQPPGAALTRALDCRSASGMSACMAVSRTIHRA